MNQIRNNRKTANIDLILQVTGRCNLWCEDCQKRLEPRDLPVSRALDVVDDCLKNVVLGGCLHIAFAGGEPLLCPREIARIMTHAWYHGGRRDIRTRFSLTTNGTVVSDLAWDLLADPRLEVGVLCDGLPEIHNLRRLHRDGSHSSGLVMQCIWGLAAKERPFHVVMRLTPTDLASFGAGIHFLQTNGVSSFRLRLEGDWSATARYHLQEELSTCRARTGVDIVCEQRCGGGDVVVVTPSGRMYRSSGSLSSFPGFASPVVDGVHATP